MGEFWLFTLSAIPQTLASIIAVTATFILFKLSKINDSIDMHCGNLEIILRALSKEQSIPKLRKPENYFNLFKEEIFSEDIGWLEKTQELLLSAYNQIERDPSPHPLTVSELKHWLHIMIRSDFSRKLNIRKTILSYLWASLMLICFTVVFCILSLSLYESLPEVVLHVLLALSVGLAGGSVAATFISIYKIVRLPY